MTILKGFTTIDPTVASPQRPPKHPTTPTALQTPRPPHAARETLIIIGDRNTLCGGGRGKFAFSQLWATETENDGGRRQGQGQGQGQGNGNKGKRRGRGTKAGGSANSKGQDADAGAGTGVDADDQSPRLVVEESTATSYILPIDFLLTSVSQRLHPA